MIGAPRRAPRARRRHDLAALRDGLGGLVSRDLDWVLQAMAAHFPGGEVIARRERISVVCGCLDGGAGKVVDDSWLVRQRSAAVSHGDGPESCVRPVYGDKRRAGVRQLGTR